MTDVIKIQTWSGTVRKIEVHFINGRLRYATRDVFIRVLFRETICVMSVDSILIIKSNCVYCAFNTVYSITQ